jgi:peptidoglycan/LPS O-acetylase OafA/YrhL
LSFADTLTGPRIEGGKRSPPSNHSQYRPDIDGLRAISIIAVVAFHAFPRILKGGFVGVDVFFVISGFLITRIIVDGLKDNAFSFVHFYERRIRRIFPALLIVLAATFVIGWLILLPQEFRQFSTHLVGAAGFVLNFILWGEAGYFDVAADTKPLLHLWSLAVEEQFYLIWPAVLWFTWRRKANLLSVTIAIGAVSFALNIATVYWDGAAAFYSPFTRFWELMLGCALAIAEPSYQRRIVKAFPADAMAWTGFALIVVAAIFLRGHAYPGVKALLPTVGAALIILGGPGAQFNNRVLSSPALVSIGKISYPLYLWHWPLLSFAGIANGAWPPFGVRATLVGVSVILSVLTYVLIEKPVRFGPNRKRMMPRLVLAMVVVGCIGAVTMAGHGFPWRPVAQANKTLEGDLRVPLESRISDQSCPKLLGIEPLAGEVCLAKSARPEFLIIGDSHAMAFNSAVRAGRFDLNTVLLSVHMGHSLSDRILQQALQLAAQTESIHSIVFVFYFNNAFFREKAVQIQRKFLQLNKRVIYIADVPEFALQPQLCRRRTIGIMPTVLFAEEKGIVCGEERSSVETKQTDVNYPQFLRSLKASDDRILIFDGLRVFCDDHRCSEGDDQGALFFMGSPTGGHVNIRGSEKMLSEFTRWLSNVSGSK